MTDLVFVFFLIVANWKKIKMYAGIRRKIQETVYIKENYILNLLTSYDKHTVNKWVFTKVL